MRAGTRTGRVDVLRVEGSLQFRCARFFRRLILPDDFDHIFVGITDLVRVLQGTLVPQDAHSDIVSRGRSWRYKSHGGLHGAPSHVTMSSGPCTSRLDSVFMRAGSWMACGKLEPAQDTLHITCEKRFHPSVSTDSTIGREQDSWHQVQDTYGSPEGKRR